MKTHKNSPYWIAAILLVLVSGSVGYGLGSHRQDAPGPQVLQQAPAETEAAAQRNLVFTFPEDRMGEQAPNISNVTTCIQLDADQILLRDGLDQGKLSEAMLTAMARLDAANGFCKETFQSHNGLAEFVYQYPELDFCVTYDVYELPNGELHLTHDLSVTDPGEGFRGTRVFFGEDRDHYRLDLEDWGLDIEVSQADSTGILLHAAQSGGQQIGTLQLVSYSIQTKDDYLQKADGTVRIEIPPVDFRMGGSRDISLNWQEDLGLLEPGDYTLQLVVTDRFDPEQVHPLMRDFYGTQYYYCDFRIE